MDGNAETRAAAVQSMLRTLRQSADLDPENLVSTFVCLVMVQVLMSIVSFFPGVSTFCVPRTCTRSFYRRPQSIVLRSGGPSPSPATRSVHVRQGYLRSGRLEARPSFPCYPAHASVLPRFTPVTCNFTRCRRGRLLTCDLSILTVLKAEIPHCASGMGNC